MACNYNIYFYYYFVIGSFFSCIIPANEFGPSPVQPNDSQVTNSFVGKGRKMSEY